jgi:hypothetical protein
VRVSPEELTFANCKQVVIFTVPVRREAKDSHRPSIGHGVRGGLIELVHSPSRKIRLRMHDHERFLHRTFQIERWQNKSHGLRGILTSL